MHYYLGEEHILLFLVQLFVLLTTAKILGHLFLRAGFPALAGEILTGILLGPTVLGRVFPAAQSFLFPPAPVQQNMLETVSWIGVLFLLLVTGFEVSVSSVWKQGKQAVIIGTVGVILPVLLGCLVFWWLPDRYWGANSSRLTFTLFLSTAAAISAIAVIAKTLHDMDILKSDLGLTTLSAFVVNDILGWLIFTLVFGLATHTSESLGKLLLVFLLIILFGAVCLTVGSRFVGMLTRTIKKTLLPQPATTLTLITCLALCCGAVTQWIGVHPILGFFFAGIMAGNASEVSERTRETITQIVHAVFVPIFFASIGLKIDFLAHVDAFEVALYLGVAVGGKFVGAWVGAVLSGMSRQDSISMGIAHIAGGPMEIILGMLALEMKLISEGVFVGIVTAALSSAIAVGPLFAWSIGRRRVVGVGQFLEESASDIALGGVTRWEAIQALCGRLAKANHSVDSQAIENAVREREEMMGTALEKGVAVPHARIKGLSRPIIVFGRSKAGIEWDARDGLPVRFVFLILTPPQDAGAQLEILAAVASCMSRPDIYARIMSTDDKDEIFGTLRNSLTAPARRKRADPHIA